MCGRARVAAQSARYPGARVWLGKPIAVLPDSRSADLALHNHHGTGRDSGGLIRSQCPQAALVFEDVVLADHEDHLLARESDRAGEDRHFEAARLRSQPCIGSRHTRSLR